MATVIKIVYNVTNPVIKVTYDVTNVTIGGQEIAPVYINMDYSSSSAVTVITSVGLTMPTGFSVANSPLTSSGTLAVTYSSGYSLPTTTKQSEWDQAYNDKINSASVSGTTTKTLTLNQQDGGTIQASWTDENTDAVTSVFGRTGAITATEGDYNLGQLGDVTLTSPTNGQVLKYNGTTWVNNTDTDTGLTSVGLSMPVAFSVANTPLTSNGTLAVTAAGTSAQYIRGDGQLANFPVNGGGGSSVNYYLNGSVSQGTFGGVTYYEMSKTPILGAGTDFTRTSAQGNGYIASFITDANDPSLLSIPGGNWNLEFYFSASSGGGGPQFYAELYKVDASNNFTLVASGVTNPEGIDNGTIVDQYFTSISVPLTSLALTDRLAVRIYVIPDGRNIVLHTENSNLCEILTTFSTGLNALNGLTAQVQYFATGTSGTDFAISSATDTHTFNLPTASATKRGALSSADWTTFNNKQNALTNPITGTGTTTYIPVFSGSTQLGNSILRANPFDLWQLSSTDDSSYSIRGASSTNGLQLKVNGVNASISNNDNGALSLGSSGTVQIQINDTGKILIGQPDDTGEKVQISGSFKTSGSAKIGTIANATTDTDKFIVSDGGLLKYRTGAEVLSDIGGQAAVSYVLTTRQLTINGTAYDLSADRSWSVGTVTSVDLSVPTGFTIANNPITSSGTLAIAFASGYSLPTTSSQTNWDAAYNDKINSASVTGTTTKTLTLTQQDGGTITASWTDINTDAVTSVFGRTGAVVATSGDYTTTLITEGTNLYYTDTRARAAITLTTTGSSGSATYSGGTLNIPSYSVAGLGAVPDNRTITINGEVYDLSANRTFEVGDYGTF